MCLLLSFASFFPAISSSRFLLLLALCIPNSLSLPLTLSLTPDSVECRSPCLEAPLSLLSHSLPHHSFIPLFSASPSPPLGLRFLRAGCRLLDSSPGWIPLDTGYDLYCIRRVQNLHNHKAWLQLYPGMRAGDFHRFISSSTQVDAEHSQSPRGQLLQECFQRRTGRNLWHHSCFLTPIQKKTIGTLHVRSLPKSTT